MICKTTKPGRVAFTLMEFMVALGISGLLLTVVGALSLYSGRSLAALANYVDLNQKSRSALDQITRDIRQAQTLVKMSTSSLEFIDYDGGTLMFEYDGSERKLWRIKIGGGVDEKKELLTDCDEMSFAIFQRTPTGNNYDFYPATSPATCKLVQVSWVCSREIFGVKRNTESVQTARIVIRKQS